MEPISGICALVSLTAEVTSTVSKVKSLVDSYRAASKEMSRLTESLSVIEGICRAVDRGLRSSSTTPTAAYRGEIPDAISSILCGLRLKLVDVEQRVGGLGPASGAMYKIKFVLAKDTILEVCGELENMISRLQFALGADVWISQVFTSEKLVAEDRRVAKIQVDDSVIETDVSLFTLTPPRRELSSSTTCPIVSRKTNRTRWYRGVWGEIDVTKTTQRTKWSELFDDGVVEESTDFSIKLPLLPYQVVFQLRSSTFAPLNYALNITHTIEAESLLGQELQGMFLGLSDEALIHGLQDLLSSGRLSIHSVLRNISLLGNSNLLQLAINHRRTLTSRFLAQYDARGKFLEGLSPDNLSHWYEPSCAPSEDDGKVADDILAIIFSKEQNHAPGDAFAYVTSIFPDPEHMIRILDHFAQGTEGDYSNSSKLVNMAWTEAVNSFTSLGSGNLGSMLSGAARRRVGAWAPVFRELVQRGADVHLPFAMSASGRGSAYFHILWVQREHQQVGDDVQEWLCILRDAGVHIPTYLERERRDLGEWWAVAESRPWAAELMHGLQTLSTVDFAGQAAPVWVWSTDPRGRAFEVLEDFKDMACMRIPASVQADADKKADDKGYGAVEVTFALCQGLEWPVCRSFVAIAEEAMCRAHEWPCAYQKEMRELVRMHQRRLERRWARWALRAQVGARKPATMPGSWVEA